MQGSENISESTLNSEWELAGGEESYELLISGYDVVDVHISSQKLCLPAQDLNKIKPVKISTQTRERLLKLDLHQRC